MTHCNRTTLNPLRSNGNGEEMKTWKYFIQMLLEMMRHGVFLTGPLRTPFLFNLLSKLIVSYRNIVSPWKAISSRDTRKGNSRKSWYAYHRLLVIHLLKQHPIEMLSHIVSLIEKALCVFEYISESIPLRACVCQSFRALNIHKELYKWLWMCWKWFSMATLWIVPSKGAHSEASVAWWCCCQMCVKVCVVFYILCSLLQSMGRFLRK